ncbi:diguanylate cyclase domain-containing protein [Isachenkonia alkalipeptolytica]|uniref:Stage 0 sporulation protein A homolog n=1 Tax=Isachenkonia alkalipeptolytica TaxID=2565777 RepID=A0AA43XJ30_9CLOT|nr:diguanylate cyclase [Isachenkonia alkalipeptolytica]NBG87662.1 diguanylate cyclase [Isachenkonia alkalipeptolytica]
MKERLLVVEDDAINRDLLKHILQSWGYEILIAVCGREALEIAGKSRPNLILLDIRLPDISGFDVFRQLKSQRETRHIPVIFTTAVTERKSRIEGLSLGAADFISKPFYKEEILLRIKNQLKLKAAEKELKDTIESQRLLLDHIEPMVWYMKDPVTLEKVNRSFADFFQRSKEVFEHTSLEKFLSPEELAECKEKNKKVFDGKVKARHRHIYTDGFGEKRLLAVTKVPKVNDRGEVEFLICSAEDITERNRKEERIRYLTFHDPLTGLYNRTYYEEELNRLDVKRNLPFSMISCDVNGLKHVNDERGHQTGDRLLVEVANILREATREVDIVARWGGDEFVILLPNTTKEDVVQIRARIETLMKDRAVDSIPVSIALGVATKEREEERIEDIFKIAEDRMYENKEDTRDQRPDIHCNC